MQGRVVPRLIGFSSEADLEFFDLFCTVDKVGARKALKALVRPVKEIAEAIHRQDGKWLTTLPGVGAATADAMIATLRKKVNRFAQMPTDDGTGEPRPTAVVEDKVIEDVYHALMSVGHNPVEARSRVDAALALGQKYRTVEEMLVAIYSVKK